MPPNNADSGKTDERLHIKCPRKQDYTDAKILAGKEEKWKRVRDNGIAHSKSQTNMELGGLPLDVSRRNRSVSSLVDELLCDIYSKLEVKRRISATTCDLSWQDSDHSRSSSREVGSFLQRLSKDVGSLRKEKARLERLIVEEGNKLVKHLKRKNILIMKREAHYDVITAFIQAISTKTIQLLPLMMFIAVNMNSTSGAGEATKMKFSLSPGSETGFSQWVDAMKMVAQLPGGMPPEFRTKLWLQLSEKHLNDHNVDWEKVEAAIFNEWTNPDDEELGVQIVKDLHRTGCSLFCGEQEQNQALLKRVLLAYARWNKNVGYCQGFNMLAALILQVMDKDEKNAVKVMIYLIEGVLPESYFANNLRGLSVDMAVLRDLLRLKLPKLSKHLDALQHDTNAGTSYEPPLTNVFTMQWFLTLFSNCLPQQTVLRVWDLVFLYGNEVLLRTALAIWGILQDRVITVESADEFYSIMGVVTREMLEFGLMDANTLVKMIAMVDPFPDELQELREKYLYNISPWTQSVQSAAKKGIRLFYSDQEDQDDTEDEEKIALATAYGVFRRRESTSRELQVSGPTLDISVLKQQYAKLRQRQRQAHVIITAACNSSLPGSFASGPSVSVNHLLMGKSALVNKGRRIGPPEGSIPPPTNKKGESKDGKKSMIAVPKDTFRRSNVSKVQHENKSNKVGKVCYENERNKVKNENEKDEKMTNHDRVKVSLESFRKGGANNEDDESGSSNSSTSTELCDDEFHRFSDFDSEDATNSDASSYHLRESSPKVIRYSPDSTDYPPSRSSGMESLENEGCDKEKLKDMKNFASDFINEIEEGIATSEKLNELSESNRCEKSEEERSSEVKRTEFNNSENLIPASADDDKQFDCDNKQNPEPEVPIYRNLEKLFDVEKSERIWKTKSECLSKEETSKRERIRRKSDLGLSVIRENLEMLHKFSQKSFESEGNKSSDVNVTNEATEETYTTERTSSYSFRDKSPGRWLSEKDDTSFPFTEEVKGKTMETEKQSTSLPSRGKHTLVEKAISPVMLEKESTAVKVNKEVNTEITFGGEEVEITTTKAKLLLKDETKVDTGKSYREDDEPPRIETFRRTREPFRGERDKRDEIKQRIEVSKSDWELKMRKIAELETTTRETLNEIQAQSNRRKTFHRSLDRNTKRTYLEDSPIFARTTLRSPEDTKIDFSSLKSLSDEKFDERKAKTSGLSFDAITSRTEKLLATGDTFDRSHEETLSKRDLSPKFEYRNPKNEQFKMSPQQYGNDFSMKSSKIFEVHSSPTSPVHSEKAHVKYSEYSSPKRHHFDDRYEDKVSLGVWQEEDKSSEGFLTRTYTSQERGEVQGGETSLRSPFSRSNFNPFPTRTLSRPKDLGVKLGLYPPTCSEGQFQKS